MKKTNPVRRKQKSRSKAAVLAEVAALLGRGRTPTTSKIVQAQQGKRRPAKKHATAAAKRLAKKDETTAAHDTATLDLIELTRAWVREQLSGQDGSHDYFHIERVWKTAKRIGAATPGADMVIVELAAL